MVAATCASTSLVRKVLADGWRTADLVQPGTRAIGTEAIGDKVVDALRGS